MPNTTRLPVSGQIEVTGGDSRSLLGLFVLLRSGPRLSREAAIGHLPLDARGEFFLTLDSREMITGRALALDLEDSEGRVLSEQTVMLDRARGGLRLTAQVPAEALRRAVPAPDLVASFDGMREGRFSNVVRMAQQQFFHGEVWARSALDCLEGPLNGFPSLLRDAHGVLINDPGALERYRGALDALAVRAIAHAVHAGREAQLLHLPIDRREGRQLLMAGRDVDPQGIEAGRLLLAAAWIAAGRDTARAWRDTRTLLTGLIGESRTAPLRSVARQALNGSPEGRAVFMQMFRQMGMDCDPFGEWHDPLEDHNRFENVESAKPTKYPLECLLGSLWENQDSFEAIVSYNIDNVDPVDACPGDEITLTGYGFGPNASSSRVRFAANPGRSPDGSAFVDAVPTSWSDTLVRVVVPEAAAQGPVSLRIWRGAGSFCGSVFNALASGNAVPFGSATWRVIEAFNISGEVTTSDDGSIIVAPGADVGISWSITPPGPGTLRVFRFSGDPDDPGTERHSQAVQAVGVLSWPIPWPTETTWLRFQLTAPGACGNAVEEFVVLVHRQAQLAVHGVEVTQAIQHYRASEHLLDPAHHGPDNSLQLVRDKSAWVRVYLRSGQDPSFDNGRLTDITGTLTVERRVGGVWNTVATASPQNGPIAAENGFASYDAERGDIDSTLNFVVPATTMRGWLRFTVQVRSPLHPQALGHEAVHTWEVAVSLRQRLNAAFITVGYDGPDDAGTGTLTLPAPTVQECMAETAWATKAFPLSGTPNVRLAGTFVTNQPLNDPRVMEGGCSLNWMPVLSTVAAMAALDQASSSVTWVYYGIVSSGIPVNVPGCSNVGTGGIAGRPRTYAHEIGHMFGLPHAPCGDVGSSNDDYPAYHPYPSGSIGEYGLDIDNAGEIANPNDGHDFMSYCGDRWISIYTYKFLTGIANLSPVIVPVGAGAPRVTQDAEPGFARSETELQPLIHMLGVIEIDGSLTVTSVARLETRFLRGRGRNTGYVAQLLDDAGRVLAQETVFGYPAAGCGCGEGVDPKQPVLFKAMLDDVAPGASLRIVKDDEVAWERRGAERPLTVDRVVAALGRRHELKLSWRIDGAPAEDVEVWIRWSNDDGRTWQALTVAQRGTSVTLDPEQTPAGKVQFQVLAHDGFHTVTAVSEPIQLPTKPPAVAILYPKSAARLDGSRQIHLFGVASSYVQGEVDPKTAIWYLDDQPVATGFDAWVDRPSPGQREIRLEVTHEGQVGEATVRIDMSPKVR